MGGLRGKAAPVRILLNGTGGTHGVSAVGRYIRSLVDWLPQLLPDDRVEVFEYLWRRRPYSWSARGVRRRLWPMPPRVGDLLLERFPPARLLLGRPDVLHLPDYHPLPARARALVCTVHHGGPLESPHLYEPGYCAWMDAWTRRVPPRCDAVITVSETMRRVLLRRYGLAPERVHAVPLGLDPGFSPEGPREEGPPYLLFVGRLSKGKNVETLCRAFSVAAARDRDLALVLVGWPDLGRETILSFVAPEVRNRVRILDPLPADSPRLPALYRGARVFCLPSLGEGWASPPLEAMACGTPVVVSNVSSLPETVGDAALTVDPFDAEAMAAALLSLHQDTALRESLIERGFRRAAEFTWERTARRTAEVYRRAWAASGESKIRGR